MITRKENFRSEFIPFNKQFKEDKDSSELLSLVKWKEGFVCKKK